MLRDTKPLRTLKYVWQYSGVAQPLFRVSLMGPERKEIKILVWASRTSTSHGINEKELKEKTTTTNWVV